jgi:hypothetical protein
MGNDGSYSGTVAGIGVGIGRAYYKRRSTGIAKRSGGSDI